MDTPYALFLLQQTKAELSRRECLGSNHAHNCEEIRKRYQPLHPDVYQLQVINNNMLYCTCQGVPVCRKQYLSLSFSRLWDTVSAGGLEQKTSWREYHRRNVSWNSTSGVWQVTHVLYIAPAPCVFSFPVFTRSFCEQLLEELQHFKGTEMPRGRPNTMNRGGVSRAESILCWVIISHLSLYNFKFKNLLGIGIVYWIILTESYVILLCFAR